MSAKSDEGKTAQVKALLMTISNSYFMPLVILVPMSHIMSPAFSSSAPSLTINLTGCTRMYERICKMQQVFICSPYLTRKLFYFSFASRGTPVLRSSALQS